MYANKPSFFIVGAPKSATTAMYSYLQKHPELFMPEAKELHYFGIDLCFLPPGRNFATVPRNDDDLRRYLSFFLEAKENQICGEASVWYLYSKEAAQEIKAFCTDAKIIIMLRNPVDLLYAMHSQFLWEGNENIESFSEAFAVESVRKAGRQLPDTMHFQQGLFYRETVKFHDQIPRYLDAFGSTNVLILIYEEFSRDPQSAYANVLDFLGVSGSFLPEFQRVNANKQVRSKLLLKMLIKPNFVVRYGAKILPRAWRSNLLRYLRKANTQYVPRSKLAPQLRQELIEEFKPDINALEELLRRDLSVWLS
jgi:hypothetical protein